MSCLTCDHTMVSLPGGPEDDFTSYHCPRCGTVKIEHGDGHVDAIVPSLVNRRREMIATAVLAGFCAYNKYIDNPEGRFLAAKASIAFADELLKQLGETK